ncbi:hypothetical protein [Salmonella phage SSE121]|uniref:C-5 cytosine-specific DNA methylase n=1 Tax=Salmonella phage SSE121 TaxID=1204529 RepID=K4IEQ8_9CAUD|nr:DNA methyltransferase [Salmonella phage SSE121]AFU63719.1 hypothetical protein [Salmonella phage SSE121]
MQQSELFIEVRMNKVVWSLFDGSGIMGWEYAKNGYKVYCFNFDAGDHGGYELVRVKHPNIQYVNSWIDEGFDPEKDGIPKPDIIFAFPPCTDMAVSGAAHFASKAAKDPLFQVKAVNTAKVAAMLGDKYGCPYMIENPVSVLSSKWRRPNHMFHPYEYGGYLPHDDVHPFFPEYINPRDSYPKKTCLWTGNGFKMPPAKPVAVAKGYSEQHKKLGGKSAKTKLIRSLTPRGFAAAVFYSNQ